MENILLYLAIYLLKLQKAPPISVDLSINILIIESTMASLHLTTASDRDGLQINGNKNIYSDQLRHLLQQKSSVKIGLLIKAWSI